MFDEGRLKQLDFNNNDISVLKYYLSTGMRVTINNLQLNGLSYEIAQRIKYMYDIVCGKLEIETTNDLSKHLKKLNGRHNKIGIQDLAISSINEIPKWAVVAGIVNNMVDERKYGKNIYTILNSKNLSMDKRFYKVVKTGQKILVRYNGSLVIPYRYPKIIDDVLEIKGRDKESGDIFILFNRKYCRLCNRYIILASLRVPEFHLGMVEIICREGTKIYVYAKKLGIKESIGYSGGTARIYDYGLLSGSIESKIEDVAHKVYDYVGGVHSEMIYANSDFELVPRVKEDSDIEE